LLQILCPSESGPTIVLSVLRALDAIADATILENAENNIEEEEFLQILYTDEHLESLCQILNQDSQHTIIQQQISLAAGLLAKTCKTEGRRSRLIIGGISDALATRLASFVIASGSQHHAFKTGHIGVMPAGPKAKLAPILHAICSMITDSKIRVSRFCCSTIWGSVFPLVDKDPFSWRAPPAKRGKQESFVSTYDSYGSSVSSSEPTMQTSHHPPFNDLATWGKQRSKASGLLEDATTKVFNGREDDDTPLVSWLIEVVKSKNGLTRLMATWLIALLFRSGSVSARRENTLSMLLVPVLTGMIDNDTVVDEDYLQASNSKNDIHQIREKAPKVLALLVTENKALHKAAVEAGVIKKLSQFLKQTFDPMPSAAVASMWSPNEDVISQDSLPEYAKLGRHGFQPIVFHTLQLRESLLVALAAMATGGDEHRKTIIENGVVPFVIESLKPRERATGEVTDGTDHKQGNPTSILIAACGTARALSRSVSSLRTILVDAKLGDPIYKLLEHSDLEVRIEATAAICNILLEFSPMREVRALYIYNCRTKFFSSKLSQLAYSPRFVNMRTL
jgi:armadillo repeat-containing protein 8